MIIIQYLLCFSHFVSCKQTKHKTNIPLFSSTAFRSPRRPTLCVRVRWFKTKIQIIKKRKLNCYKKKKARRMVKVSVGVRVFRSVRTQRVNCWGRKEWQRNRVNNHEKAPRKDDSLCIHLPPFSPRQVFACSRVTKFLGIYFSIKFLFVTFFGRCHHPPLSFPVSYTWLVNVVLCYFNITFFKWNWTHFCQ